MPFEPVVWFSEIVPLLMNVPSAADGAVKVTEAPDSGAPLELTRTENVPNGLPTACGVVYPPACAAIVMVGGGGGVVTELLQPTNKAMAVKARISAIEIAILERSLRFKVALVSARLR